MAHQTSSGPGAGSSSSKMVWWENVYITTRGLRSCNHASFSGLTTSEAIPLATNGEADRHADGNMLDADRTVSLVGHFLCFRIQADAEHDARRIASRRVSITGSNVGSRGNSRVFSVPAYLSQTSEYRCLTRSKIEV